MIPAHLALVEELPLTSNGKLDRRALAALWAGVTKDLERTVADDPLVASVTSIVEQIMGLPRVDPSSNLMSLGITSIQIVRIANELQKQFGFRPRVAELFRGPTIRGLADLLRDHMSSAAKPESAPTESSCDGEV